MHRHTAAFILGLANRVFGDPARANEWLDRPSVQLGGRPPRSLLKTEDGVRRVEELLTQVRDDDRHRHR